MSVHRFVSQLTLLPSAKNLMPYNAFQYAAKHPQKCPFPWGYLHPHLINDISCSVPNCVSIGSAVFAQLMADSPCTLKCVLKRDKCEVKNYSFDSPDFKTFAVARLNRDVAAYHTHLASIQARSPDPIEIPSGKSVCLTYSGVPRISFWGYRFNWILAGHILRFQYKMSLCR